MPRNDTANANARADDRAVPFGWPALVVWALAWLAMGLLDLHIDLANKALVLVLAAAVAAIWWGPWLSLLACSMSVLAFNYAFVPPRGSFTVGLQQHALLLGAMLGVGGIVALLMHRQRQLATEERVQAQRSEQLRQLGEALREVDEEPGRLGPLLQEALARCSGAAATLLLPQGEVPADAAQAPHAGRVADRANDPVSDLVADLVTNLVTNLVTDSELLGAASADERAGLWLCLRQHRAMGPGTGWHEEQPAWYLPMRGRRRSYGAALLSGQAMTAMSAPGARALREHAQALCDQLGAALERIVALRSASAARQAAQAQALRNTLLAAIAHDHRTPLANILGAASALHDQADRLSVAQRQRLAATIADEAAQLSRLTDNTLQLARLESAALGLALQRDWESAEELVGSVLRRMRSRKRDASPRLVARVEPGLPPLRCDAMLMVQLLDNLVDNALKHGGGSGPVEVVARRAGERLVIAVRDRGPGVPAADRERIFEAFQRGAQGAEMRALRNGEGDDEAARRGAGVGLALCRAIARAHGAELRLRPRQRGGSSFELELPIEPAPQAELGAAHAEGASGATRAGMAR